MLGSSRGKLVPFSEVNWDEEIFTDLNKGHWRTVSGRELTPKQYDFLHALVSTCLPDALLKYDESDVMRIYAEVYRRGCDEAAGYKMKDNGRILTFHAHRYEALRTYYAIKPVIGGILSKALVISGQMDSTVLLTKIGHIIMGTDDDYIQQMKLVMKSFLKDVEGVLEKDENDKIVILSDDQKREVIKIKGKIIENAQKNSMIPQAQRVVAMVRLYTEMQKNEEPGDNPHGLDPSQEIPAVDPAATQLAKLISDKMSREEVDEINEGLVKGGSGIDLMESFIQKQKNAKVS